MLDLTRRAGWFLTIVGYRQLALLLAGLTIVFYSGVIAGKVL